MLYLTKDGNYILQDPIVIPGSYNVNEKKCFVCDDLMCPIISELLKKGYETEFCCSGHYYDSYIKQILDNEENTSTSIWNNNTILAYTSITELLKAEDIYLDPYIKFGRKVRHLPTPPKGWKVEYGTVRVDPDGYQYVVNLKKPKPEDKYRVVLRYKRERILLNKEDINPFDIMRKLVDINESLYKWVLTLEDFKEEM